jgi:hypothetical protein
MKNCLTCNKPFEPRPYKDQKYCSYPCQQKRSRRRPTAEEERQANTQMDKDLEEIANAWVKSEPFINAAKALLPHVKTAAEYYIEAEHKEAAARRDKHGNR